MAGYKPLPLVGGATELIGDPTGRSAERQENSHETVIKWSESIKQLSHHGIWRDQQIFAELVNTMIDFKQA